jgi:FKBP-type peptidyl-prolyl cis-trans isomerase 2
LSKDYLIIQLILPTFTKKYIMKQITESSTVTVNYTGKLEDGTVFDSSMKEGREPLTAVLGKNELIRGFEQGLIGMSEGETKTIEIEAVDAYGEVNDDMFSEVPKENLPEGVKVGEMLQGMTPMGPVNVRIAEVRENSVIVDANHPLAGKKLIFDLEIVSIS